MDTIEALPRGVEWNYRPVTLHGDLTDDSGNARKEDLELWYRDPVEVVRELMGNPMFRHDMRYAPERVYQDSCGEKEVVNEMWTAEWWWKMQVSLEVTDIDKPKLTVVIYHRRGCQREPRSRR